MLRTKSIVMTALVASCSLAMSACQSTGAKDDVVTQEMQQSMTPAQVLADLKAGNRRFARGQHTSYDWKAQVQATSTGQHPKAIVLSCLDSRVPVETVFDQGIGDLFVGRVAGNFENVDMLGSFEFGTAVAGSKLIVVLGHTACGAVKGAIDNAELGNLTATLDNIEPAIQMVNNVPGARTSSNEAYVTAVVEANVRKTVDDILDRSSVIREMVEAGDLMVVGGVYDLETGRVTWMD